MPPRKYSQNKDERRGKSVWAAIGPALDDYEKTLKDNPGTSEAGSSWIGQVLRSAPIPGVGLLMQSPVGDAIMGKAERPIQSVLEEGEDAPVIGPAIGATGRLFDLLSRGNYAASNVAELAQEREDAGGFLPDFVQDALLNTFVPGLNAFLEANFKDGSTLDQLQSADRVGVDTAKALLGGGAARDVVDLVQGNEGPTYTGRFLEGITGTRKNNFGEVLEKEGVTNPAIRTSAGLGFDVLFDPTSYVGLNVVKGLNRGDATAASLADEVGAAGPLGETPFENLALNTPYPAAPVPPKPTIPNWMAGGMPEAPTLPPPISRAVQDIPPTPSVGGNFASAISALPANAGPAQVSPFGFIAPKLPDSPVEEVVSGVEKGLSTGVDAAVPLSGAEEMETIVSPFGTITRPKAKPVDPTKAIPAADANAILADNIMALMHPEKAKEAKWLGLFDDTTPEVLKKNFKPEPGVELLTKTDPDELRLAAESPAKEAAEDWLPSKAAYEPDGPVDIPLESLATDPIEGLLKAPYEVAGNIRKTDEIPNHREFMRKSDAPLEPVKIDVNAVLPGKLGGPPGWDEGFNLGKLPDVPKGADDGYVALRIGDAEIFRSHRAYNVGRGVLKPFLYGDGAANALAKSFSMQAHLPDGMDQMLRVAQNNRMAKFDRSARAIVSHLGKLTPGERRQIALAVDENINLSSFAATHKDDLFQTLEDYRQLVKGINKEMWVAEDAHGLVGKRLDNYVKRIVKKDSDPKKLANLRNKDGSYKYTLQELMDKGVDVETDIAETLRERLATSARNLTKADMEWEALMRFGVPNRVVKQHPELVDKFDLVKWKSSSKQMGGFGHYIPKKHQEALEWFSQVTLKDAESAKLGHLVDRAVGEWKYLALLTPGRHVRDTIGDVIMNAQAGVWNPDSYRKASKTLGAFLPNKNIRDIYEADIASKVTGIPAKADVGNITIAGQKIPIDTMWEDIYVASGAKSGQLSTEVQRMMNAAKGSGERAMLSPLKPYDAVKRNVGRFSDAREDWSRLTHVIDYLDRNAKSAILNEHGALTSYGKELTREAGESVRKWNIDYGNLTPFEQNTARRLIPFYTFMRHNIPRQMELLFTKPGFMALYPKGNNLMQGAFGTDNGDDHLLPPWVRETAPFRIQMQKQEQKGALGWILNKFGASPGMQVLGDPHTSTTPIGDLTKLNAFTDPTNPLKAVAQEFGSMVTPVLKIPAELATGTSIFNGAPIKGDYYSYFANQLPQSRMAYGQDPTGIARSLTGLPIRPVTEKMQDNEAYRRELEAKRMFKQSMTKNLPAQYRGMDPAKQREVYRNLLIAQGGTDSGG